MTSQELVVQSTAYSRASLEERQRYTAALATAGDLLPGSMQTMQRVDGQMKKVGDRGKVMLMAETGDMLGIHPIAALTGVHIIEGKPSISANLMGGLVRKAGHRLRVRTEGKLEDKTLTATATLVRSDDPDFEFKVVWDVAKAERAGLYPGKPKSNWQTYTEAMLKARAISEVIREGAPDVLMGGNVYTPEELGAQVTEQGDPVEYEAAPSEPRPAVPPQEKVATPIVDESTGNADAAQGFADAAAAAGTREDVLEIFRQAKMAGQLSTLIFVGDEEQELGQFIIGIGQAMAVAETENGEPIPDEGEPVVMDEEVVIAEVVEDGSDS
jgi:hypothetical protein